MHNATDKEASLWLHTFGDKSGRFLSVSPSQSSMTTLRGWHRRQRQQCQPFVVELSNPCGDGIQIRLVRWTRAPREIRAPDDQYLDIHSGSGRCPIAATTGIVQP